jgi:succinoglycan biosynthesis transport protein ExoP
MNMHTHPSPVPGSQPAAPTDPKLILQIVLITLRCWWKVAVPVGIILAALAVAAVIRWVDPTYTATAWVLIRERPDYLVSQSASSQDPRRQLNNQLELIESPLLLNAVLQVKGVAETPELIGKDDQVNALRQLLNVQLKNQSDFCLIRFTSTSPQHASLIVNAVAERFLKEQERINSSRMAGMINSLDKLLKEQDTTVHDRESLYKSLAMSQGVELRPDKKDSETQANSLISEITSNQMEAERQAQELELQIAAEKTAIAENRDPAPLPNVVERAARESREVAAAIGEIAMLKDDLAKYEKTSRDAKLIQDKRAKVASAEQRLQELVLPEARQQIRNELIDYERAARETALADLEHQLERTRLHITLCAQQIEKLEKDQATTQGETIDVEIAKIAFDHSMAQFQRMQERKQSLLIEQKAPAPAELFQKADVPAAPDSELPFKHMGLAGGAAFLLPFGLAVGLEYLRRRVSNREQLEQGGQIAVLGEVTALPRRRRSQKDGHANRDLQLFEESIDGLRTFLTLRESMIGMKVIAVSSAISREGKTSIAAQLAVSLASATGERTLLIDGDMRSPDVDTIFGVERGPGLVEVLQGEVQIEEAIETDFNNTLHLLTAGNLTTNPHRLLGNGEFATLLSTLRGTYHYIVIDTPPILSASEALVMARAADAAILCARRDFSRVDQVAEARDRLRQSGVKTAGAVLSGIPPRMYERRYGSYYYKSKVGA